MTKHAPGPWTIAKHDHGDRRGLLGVFAPNANLVVECSWGKSIAESDANTRLIAAAPDMLATLKGIERFLTASLSGESFDPAEECLAEVRAAIAKAEGTP